MQIKLFTIPVASPERGEEDLNKFLRSHRVLQVERHFVSDGGGYWALLVEYMDGDPAAEVPPAQRRSGERVDYAKELSDEQRQRYEHFREIRSQIAKERSIPAYLVFTNEELATLARVPELRQDTVRDVKGIAPSRLKDFVHFFYVVTNAEESRTPDAADSRQGEPA